MSSIFDSSTTNRLSSLLAPLTPLNKYPKLAATPFNHEKADVILRSSDDVDFHVFKLFLSLASPFFETLFDIPQPAEASADQEFKDGLAVVPMAEDSTTLDALLRFCYPCTLTEDPTLDLFEDVLSVLEAAKKYSLDAIETKIRQAFANPAILEVEPLRCFAIAHRGQLPKETLLAAKYTLTQPLIPSTFKEIDLITASDLLTLLTYHQQCGNAVYTLRADMSWIKSHYQTTQGCAWVSGRHANGSNCHCPRSPVPKFLLFESYSLQWWEDFMEETFAALRDKPCDATVKTFAEKTIQSVRNRGCTNCSANVETGMRGFCDLLEKKIDLLVSQVKLDFNPWGGSGAGGSFKDRSGPQGGTKKEKKGKKA